MSKLMCWHNSDSNKPKILYLKETPESAWIPYNQSRHFVPDYLISGGSKGYATLQNLLKQGWKLVSSDVLLGMRV